MTTPVTNAYLTQNVNLFHEVMNKMLPDFGNDFLHTVLCWCGVVDDPEQLPMWTMFVVRKENGEYIGVTGLYELPHDKHSVWLGWFGVFEEYRGQNYGKSALELTEKIARDFDRYQTIMLYCSKDVIPFYKKQGYEVFCTVEDYLNIKPEVDKDNFDIEGQFVMSKDLF